MNHPDPGGVFASDTHRRVLGHLSLPNEDAMSNDVLGDRLAKDEHTEDSEFMDVLKDLEADGHAAELKDGWQQTKAGHDALNAPVPNGNEVH